jgi:hypothetical protein
LQGSGGGKRTGPGLGEAGQVPWQASEGVAQRTWVVFRSDDRTLEFLARRGIQPGRLALEAFERQVRALQRDDGGGALRP